MIRKKLNRIKKSIINGFQRFMFRNAFASKAVAGSLYLFKTRVRKRAGKALEKKIRSFAGEDISRARVHDLMKKILYAQYYYGVSLKEWFLYDFEKLPENERLEYVGGYELRAYYDRLYAMGRSEIFWKKNLTYEQFHDFFGREMITVGSADDRGAFFSFLERHPSCFFKPVAEYGGTGNRRLEIGDAFSAEQAWDTYKDRVPFILEELIVQSPEISAFYPLSVNTIRYNTFYHNDKLMRLQAVFRIGRGGSIVDNATSGGIYSLVDTETGRILCPARSFKGELFETHPDTGTQLNGNFIPHWAELNELLEKLVRVVPEQKLVGWDFALTPKGWVMVEGNTRPALQDFDLSHGLRKLLTASFGQVVKMWA